MSVRSPWVRRWLLYGSLASFAHLPIAGVFVDVGVVSHLTEMGEWLTFPGFWFHRKFARELLAALPPNVQAFYTFNRWIYLIILVFVANSVLWGFAITGAVIYIVRRYRGRQQRADLA